MTPVLVTRMYGHTKVKVAHFDDHDDFLDIIALVKAIDGKARAKRLSLVCAANRGAARRLYREGRVVIFTDTGAR